ncbi:MAG TPA: ABC transporter ATP-binding protein [Coriobacteriia bacterium]|nr:ABC transporter ATP-binding protein [Coriobacteriia bacterium]
MDTDAIILRATDISYRYGKVDVWQHLGFELARGVIAFLVGANGSGKSTLLRCLAGWSPVSSGRLLFKGRPLSASDRRMRAGITFVPDVPAFYDDLTAEEHIDFVLRANRRPERKDEAERLLKALGLFGHKARYPSTYSRGMRVKLGLVLALCLETDLLLLDEPFGPLDDETSAVLCRELAASAAGGTTVIISHHGQVPGLSADKTLNLREGGLEVRVGSGDSPSDEAVASDPS